jgi:hypothetical protein
VRNLRIEGVFSDSALPKPDKEANAVSEFEVKFKFPRSGEKVLSYGFHAYCPTRLSVKESYLDIGYAFYPPSVPSRHARQSYTGKTRAIAPDLPPQIV